MKPDTIKPKVIALVAACPHCRWQRGKRRHQVDGVRLLPSLQVDLL